MTRGRPITGNCAKTVRMEIRLEPGEATAYDEAASKAGLSRSEWMRGICNDAVNQLIEACGSLNKSRANQGGAETTQDAIRPKPSRARKSVAQ